jgi:hypothetical protein
MAASPRTPKAPGPHPQIDALLGERDELKLKGQFLPCRNSTARAVHHVGVNFRIGEGSSPIKIRLLEHFAECVNTEVRHPQVPIRAQFHRCPFHR